MSLLDIPFQNYGLVSAGKKNLSRVCMAEAPLVVQGGILERVKVLIISEQTFYLLHCDIWGFRLSGRRIFSESVPV